jgi:hypothetical protein
MNTSINHSHSDPEERFEAWLASQPLTPSPDFVFRTLARIRAEKELVASAKAGNESALDSLLDGWLGESPLEPGFEPAEMATQTRRTATREEQDEDDSDASEPRRIILFPAWARSIVALAAAASIALLAYLGTTGTPASNLASTPAHNSSPKVAQVDATDDSALPAPGSESYSQSALSQLNDSLKDGKTLLDDDAVALLPGNGDPGNSDPVGSDTAVE